MKQAIHETRRVLAPGDNAFVVLRTTQDYRFGWRKQLGVNTFQLEISDTNESGTVQHFLTAEDVPSYFADVSQPEKAGRCWKSREGRVIADVLRRSERQSGQQEADENNAGFSLGVTGWDL